MDPGAATRVLTYQEVGVVGRAPLPAQAHSRDETRGPHRNEVPIYRDENGWHHGITPSLTNGVICFKRVP